MWKWVLGRFEGVAERVRGEAKRTKKDHHSLIYYHHMKSAKFNIYIYIYIRFII